MSDPFAAALERAKQIAAKLKKVEAKPVETQRQVVVKPKDNSLKKYIPVIKTIEINVPNHMIPFVLGRNGENLEKIQEETNTNIDFNEKTPDDGRLCKVRGEETCVEDARARIEDIVHGAGALQSLMPSHKVGDETIYIQVPAMRVGLVIGKGGETIKALQDRTGARINVTKDDEGGPNRTIVVAGSKLQLAMAQAEIDDIVNGTGFAGAFGHGGSTESIKVQKDKVGLIIGKGGEAIKQIQGDCNVKLNVEQYADDNGERTVTIAGTPECIAMAKEMIWEKIDGRRGISESNLGEQFNASYASQDPAYAAAYGSGTVTKKFDPVVYAPYYKQYYESLGYTFPEGFDIVGYLRQQQESL